MIFTYPLISLIFLLQLNLIVHVTPQYLSRLLNHHRRNQQLVKRNKLTISEGRIRLVGGSTRSEGNVEIYHLGRWGTICDDEWDEKEAKVVCSNLGYSTNFSAIPTSNSQFGKGRKLIWMDNLYCNGNETRLDKCQFDGWKTHDCVSNEAAGVICKPNQQLANYVTHYNQQLIASNAPEQRVNIINMNQPVPKRNHQLQANEIMDIRLNGGRTNQEGRVEVKMTKGNTWYTICGNGWSLLEAMVVCRSLGLGFGQFASIGEFNSNQSSPIIQPIYCKGYESNLNQCKTRTDHISSSCGQANSDIAGVMCTKDLPDLAPDEKEFGSSVYLEDRPLGLLQCAMEENCLASDAYTIDRRGHDWIYETRRLLRFTTRIGNIGTTDFIPFLPKQEWEWHSCHRHYHSMEVFAHFDLLDLNGKRIAEGHKASFCLEDNDCSPGSKVKYSCKNYGNQGISVGCVDIYLSSIDCQWIDITHLNPGSYQLKLSVNPEFKVSEISFDNNAALCYLHYDSTAIQVYNCTLTRP